MISKIDDSSPGIWATQKSEGRWKMAKHLSVLDQCLVRATYEPGYRFVVQMPPRHGKSTLSSMYFPAWYRRKFPRRNIILWSATARLAQRFSTHARELCGLPLDEKTHSWENWKVYNTPPNEGEYYAAGIGGGGTMGAGAHLALIDDYHRSVEDALSETIRQKQQEWFLAGCVTRLEPGASLGIIATRWHRDDLIGFALRMAEDMGEKWDVIKMKAIQDDGTALWPERWPIELLEQERRRKTLTGYPWMWDALYQQEPPDVLDSEWDPLYFRRQIMFEDWPTPNRTRFELLMLDPSVGKNERADYSAIVKMAVTMDDQIWIDADIKRRDGERQVDDLLAWSIRDRISLIGIEFNGFQGVLQAPFERRCKELQHYPLLHGINSKQDKVMRIREAITPFLSRGMLRFRINSPGVALLLEQLRGFPSHRFFDGPDALAMGIQMAQHFTQFGVEDSSNLMDLVTT